MLFLFILKKDVFNFSMISVENVKGIFGHNKAVCSSFITNSRKIAILVYMVIQPHT